MWLINFVSIQYKLKIDKDMEKPIKVVDYVNNFKSKFKDEKVYWSTLSKTFQDGEKNDRKRTQPLIDAVFNAEYFTQEGLQKINQLIKSLNEDGRCQN